MSLLLTYFPACNYLFSYLSPSSTGGEDFSGGSDGKTLAMQETQVPSLGQEDPLERGMATDSRILTWRIPRTEEPGGLKFMGSQRVRYD